MESFSVGTHGVRMMVMVMVMVMIIMVALVHWYWSHWWVTLSGCCTVVVPILEGWDVGWDVGMLWGLGCLDRWALCLGR